MIFSVLKSLYAAILREIELGYKKWSDDFSYVENAILAKQNPKLKTSTSRKDRMDEKARPWKSVDDDIIWYCSLYQRNKCSHKTAHSLVVKGKFRWAHHICATCWQKDSKKLEHPECSSACPYSQK